MRHVSLAVVSGVCFAVLSGCSKKLKTVSAEDQEANMSALLTESNRQIRTTSLKDTVKIEDYPMLEAACSASYPNSATYEFDGQMMRYNVNRYAYEMGLDGFPDSKLYNHMYAICFDFYPLNADSPPTKQEAIFVHYLGTIESDLDRVLAAIEDSPGAGIGLMLDAGFHTGDVTPENNSWPRTPRKTYPDDPTEVLFLKMEAFNMKVLNGYGASKIQNLLGYEFIHGNVTMVDGKPALTDINTAVINDILRDPSRINEPDSPLLKTEVVV